MTSNDWKEVTLEEICYYGDEKILSEEVTTNNYISTENMLPYKNGITNASSLPTTKKIRKYEKGDILISNIRPYFQKIWLSDRVGGCSNDVLVVKSQDDNKLDKKYLYYSLFQDEFFNYVTETSKGTKMPRGDKTAIMNYSIMLPPLSEQNAIANILSTLDEKIETNNQINEKLEEMAQALFKRWFVDFEFPNKNGEPYKSSGGEMVESELGMIPKGWKIVKLGDVIDFQNGYAFKSKDLLDVESDSTFRVFKMGNIRKGGGINHSGTKSYIERDKCQNLSNYIIKKGDLLMCMTDMKSNVALLGHTALMDRDNEYILNQRVGLIRTKDSKVINYPYLYILTNSEDFINNLRSRANSGVQVNLSTKEIKDSLICLPDQKVHSLFNEITERMFEKSFQVEDENQKLKLIRDTLLPKLMSGEIRVQLEDEVLEVQS